MPEQANEANNWEIATACDIGLGRYFQEGQIFKGRTVHINEEAIHQTVQSFDPKKTGTLIFRAASITGSELFDPDNKELARGRFKPDPETGDMEVLVAINGFSRRTQMRGAFFGVEKMKPQTVIPSRIHKTAVHELRHAADFTDEELESIHKKENELTRARQSFILGMMAIRKLNYAGWGAAVGLLTTEAVGSPEPATISAGLIGGGIGWLFAKHGRNKAMEQAAKIVHLYIYYTKSTEEKRARQAGRRAQEHPEIISIH